MSNYKKIQRQLFIICAPLFVILAHPVFGWDDQTHLAVAKASGYSRWYYAVGPDITKVKAGKTEIYNHFYNNNKKTEVTPQMVIEQSRRYNDPADAEGHLYGAILASLREYTSRLKESDPEYHLAFFAHYVADLSAPLHNVAYDDFNRLYHAENDGVVGKEVLEQLGRIKKNMPAIRLRPDHFEEDLAGEVAKIANRARLLGYKLQEENRKITADEAYIQLGQSASLLNAVLQHLGKVK